MVAWSEKTIVIERGRSKQEEFMKKVHEMMVEQEKQRIPIAQPLPLTTDEPECLVKPTVKESTRPVDLVLHSVYKKCEACAYIFEMRAHIYTMSCGGLEAKMKVWRVLEAVVAVLGKRRVFSIRVVEVVLVVEEWSHRGVVHEVVRVEGFLSIVEEEVCCLGIVFFEKSEGLGKGDDDYNYEGEE
ncbi:WVD2-like protein 4 [Tanacetum coccineum]